MNKSLKTLLVTVVAGAFALAAATAEESAVAKGLNGKLVKIEGGKAKEATLAGDPQYYVFYHSASW